jgi:L-lactate dehydrogenase complex protein LldE
MRPFSPARSRVRVSVFITCLGDYFFANAVHDAIHVLEGLGARVDVPAGQTCCGQPAYNAGYLHEAVRVARHTVEVLADAGPVVTPSGSCAAMIRTVFPRLLASDAAADAATDLAARTWELSEYIVHQMGRDRLGQGLRGRRIAYHHGCHALRELGVASEPVALLEGAGATVVDWPADRECCGFGGTFSVKLPPVSAGMADRKLDTLPDVDLLTSADPGCLLQLDGRARHRRTGLTVRHLASVLREGMDGSA